MTRAKQYFFAIMLLAALILFSTTIQAAEMCDCSMKSDCASTEFCDYYTGEPGAYNTLVCNFDGPYTLLCENCINTGGVCRIMYDDEDCCGLNCTFAGGTTYRCCPNGEKWNVTTNSCQAPPTCYELGGDSACTAPGKSHCCGGPSAGHCEACCAPESTYQQCPSCQYCNTTAGINNYKCSIKPLGCCSTRGESCASTSCCPGLTCTSNRCCYLGELWNATSNRCYSSCPESSAPGLPASGEAYACANEHTGGSVEYGGACGVGCYNYWYNNVKYTEACGVTEQCVEYESYYDYPIEEEGVKFCNGCVQNLAACCANGMAAKTDVECKACNSDWYLSGCHCCPKGRYWDTVTSNCVERDPCYSPLGWPLASSYCNLFAPNIGSYGTCSLSSWLSSSPYCVDYSLITPRTCCFIDAGIFGFAEPGDQFYYWHERIPVVVY